MVRIGPLSDEQRQALEQVRRRAVGRVSQRAHMVLLSARGYTVEQIAEIFGVGEDVVRKWLHRYERQGPLGPGRPSSAGQAPRGPPGPGTSWMRRRATRRATTGWCRAAGRSGCWRRSWLPASAWSCRPRVSDATCTRPAGAGHGHGWPRRPTRRAASARRTRPRRSSWRCSAQAVASAATLLYLDECDLHLLPVIRACWMKGPRLRVPTPGQNAKRALFGALNARTGGPSSGPPAQAICMTLVPSALKLLRPQMRFPAWARLLKKRLNLHGLNATIKSICVSACNFRPPERGYRRPKLTPSH